MQFTRTTFRRLIKIFFAILLVLIVILYAVWRGQNFVQGPEIQISSPENGSATSSPLIYMTGIASRVTGVAINGRQIVIDEQGSFTEPLLLFPGINIITVEARDQFNRKIQRQIQIMGLADR